MLAPEKFLDRNRLKGIIGSSVRRSLTTKATSAPIPTTSGSITPRSVKPASAEEIRPYTTPPSPIVANAAPGMSSFLASGSLLSGTYLAVMSSTAMASGTFIRKAARHETFSTRNPPRTGPRAVVTPESPDHVPMAFPRSSSLNEALIIAREPGTSIAPPTPCTARATISISGLVESPHHTEASVKTITPKEKMRRRP